MSSLNRIELLETKLFDAALGELEFEQLLQSLIGHFGGSAGVIFELNRTTGEISNWVGPGLEAGERDYAEYLNGINPRMRFSLRHAPGQAVYEGLFTNETAMKRSEFYDAIMRLSGVRYFLGSRLYDDGDISVFHSIEFDARTGHPDRDKIDVFSKLSANLGKSWRLAKTRSEAAPAESGGFLFEHLPWAIFGIDHGGRISPQNANAGELLASSGSLSLVEGRLLTASAKVNDALLAFAKSALSGHAASIALPIGPTGVPMIFQSLPVPGKHQAFLFVRNPLHSSDFLEKTALDIFGLTAMESRVLASLSRGNELQLVADELQLSRNTVRNHMSSIYRKTGARNRTDLLVRVLCLIE